MVVSSFARRLASLLLVVVVAGLVGCASIPHSGSVEIGQPDTSDQSLDFDFLPSGPQKGATQQEILTGFIDAASSPQNNYRIAREFLTTGAEWDPSENVYVDQGQRSPQQAGDSTITLSITPVALVDDAGGYSEVSPATPIPLVYKFVQQEGEWRISQPPTGVVIDRATFGQVFSAHSLYFFDPSFAFLVPDVRWFPSRADQGTSTTIVTELLDGPSPWLADSGAVVSAFPAGTALNAEAVPIVDQEAAIDLNSAALEANPRDWELMQLQLVKSLSNVSTVTGVKITVAQNPVEIGASPALPTTPRVDARPLLLGSDGFGYLSGDTVSGVAGLSKQIEDLGPSAVTLAAAQTSAVVGNRDGVFLVRVGEDPLRLDQRRHLVAPSVDPLGYTWTVPSLSPNELVAFSADGSSSSQIATTWPEASSIASLVVSRDGTRLLALVSDGTQATLLAAGISRSESGVPLSVGEPETLFTTMGTPVVANWIDDATATVVIADSQGVDKIWSQQLGGKRISLGSTAGVVAIAGSNTIGQVRVLTSQGELQQQRGVAWQTTMTGVSVLGTQTGASR